MKSEILIGVFLSNFGAVNSTVNPTFCPQSPGVEYKLCQLEYNLPAKASQSWLIADNGTGQFQLFSGNVNAIVALIERDEQGRVTVQVRNKSNAPLAGVLEIEIR